MTSEIEQSIPGERTPDYVRGYTAGFGAGRRYQTQASTRVKAAERRAQVAALIDRGLTSGQIAIKLGFRPRLIRTDVQIIRRRTRGH